MAQNLNHTAIQALKPRDKAYKVTDGGGLYLEVLPSGAMVWRYQYLLAGKREAVTIGPYREASAAQSRVIIDLKTARAKRDEYKQLVVEGKSPARAKQANKQAKRIENERAATFKGLAERWLEDEVSVKSEGWQYSVNNWLKLDIYPALGSRDPQHIEAFHIEAMLNKIVKRGAPSSANQVRKICRHIGLDGSPVVDRVD